MTSPSVDAAQFVKVNTEKTISTGFTHQIAEMVKSVITDSIVAVAA